MFYLLLYLKKIINVIVITLLMIVNRSFSSDICVKLQKLFPFIRQVIITIVIITDLNQWKTISHTWTKTPKTTWIKASSFGLFWMRLLQGAK